MPDQPVNPFANLTSEQILQFLADKGADNLKLNGYVYAITNGQAVQVPDPADPTGKTALHEDPKPDTSPTTIHVPGKGTLQYNPPTAAGGQGTWTIVPGSEETPDAPKVPTFQGADGRQYEIHHDAQGNPFAQVFGGDNPATTSTAGAVVSPGQGVRQADGTYTVPVPANAPAQTPEQTALTTAQTGLVNAQTAAVQTPAQAQADKVAQINATYAAQTEAALKLAKDKIAAGIELTEADKIAAEAAVQAAAAQRDSALRTAEAEATAARDQPNKDRAAAQVDAQIATGQQNAATNAAQVENTRISNDRTAQFNRDNAAVGVLKDQATAGQNNIESLVKSGIAPSKGSIAMLRNPLEAAFSIMQSQVQDGSLQPNNIPTPIAPRPAGAAPSAMSAPVPAPAPAPSGGSY